MANGTSRTRIALAAMVIILAALLWPGLRWIIYVIALGAAIAGALEIHSMAKTKGIFSSATLKVSGAAAFVLAGMASLYAFSMAALPIVLILLILAFSFQIARRGYEDAFYAVPLNLFAPLYVGLPLALGLQILQYDRMLFLLILLAVWTLDSVAYFSGKQWGSRKLAPTLSPSKTVEGAVGGFVGCVLLCFLIKAFLSERAFQYSWGETLIIGILLGTICQVADIAESMLKRDAGVKDSGHTGTGHGGVLDRVDSLLFAFPLIYVFLALTERLEAVRPMVQQVDIII